MPLWPPPLRVSDKIALCSPAGALDDEALAVCRLELEQTFGERLRVDPEIRRRKGYLAGSDRQRAEHLTSLWLDDSVGAVLCTRGGFGSSRLLPLLDLELMASRPRLLLGFSDITCLLNVLAARGLVTVHGPVATQFPRLEPDSRTEFMRLLRGETIWPRAISGVALTPGQATGPLLGGNLSMICHLLGTPFMPPLQGAILVLEEVSEPPYRLERLLTQLELAGVWDQVAGVAVGTLTQEASQAGALDEVVLRRLAGLGLPVLAALPVGHGEANRCLPLGALAELDTELGELRLGVDFA